MKVQNGKLGIEEFLMFFFLRGKWFSFLLYKESWMEEICERFVLPIAWKKRKAENYYFVKTHGVNYNKPLSKL